MRASTRSSAGAAAVLLVLAGLLGACGADGDTATTDDGPTATESTEATTTTTDDEASEPGDDGSTDDEPAEPTETTVTETTSTDPSTSDEGRDTETSELDTLPDGDHYGYMAGLESGTVEGQAVQVIIFDKVDFLTGEAAVTAAQEDGVIPADQDSIENDYYIRNQNQTVRRLAVVPDAQIFTLAGGGTDQVASSVDEVWNQPYLFKINVGNVRGITTISSIEAVYLP
jgi:hypothetical protein